MYVEPGRAGRGGAAESLLFCLEKFNSMSVAWMRIPTAQAALHCSRPDPGTSDAVIGQAGRHRDERGAAI